MESAVDSKSKKKIIIQVLNLCSDPQISCQGLFFMIPKKNPNFESFDFLILA
jgi:hypothetical protein